MEQGFGLGGALVGGGQSEQVGGVYMRSWLKANQVQFVELVVYSAVKQPLSTSVGGFVYLQFIQSSFPLGHWFCRV